MFRLVLGGAFAVLLSCAPSLAEPIFDGTVTFADATNNCGPTGAAYPAIYRPQISSAEPKTGLVIFQYRSGAGFQRATNGQFNGSGVFAGIRLTSSAKTGEISGSFALAQAPATVTTATQSIILSGSFTPTTGCRFVFKSVFLRRPGT